MINQRDRDIFRYLTNLQVQDLRHISMGYKMKLYFQTNPYFTNMVIVKEFQRNRSGRLVSHSTPIRWHRGQEPQAYNRRSHDTRESFFNWFSNHSLPEADRIAEIIKNDLWVNPVRYYMRRGGYRSSCFLCFTICASLGCCLLPWVPDECGHGINSVLFAHTERLLNSVACLYPVLTG